ncbi:MAG: hypothetical protein AUG51_24290 [Acidobacteria bacterium 13_1_20CM_3_53_8]|nr:MAG: hypothetical protein AUG51_24290 [Acidobacteria bacterium 13_1_20CM_3_53_8]
MTTITLDLPDEVAEQLKIDPQQLSALIREAITARTAKHTPDATASKTEIPVYQELVDFLTSSPSTEQIIAFKISAEAQERLNDLLYKNREEVLTQNERTELETYLHLSQLITRLKARARNGQPFIS